MRAATVIKPLVAGLLTAFVTWHGAAVPAQDDRIVSFTLSSGGLAQIERQVRVTEDTARLPVPLHHINDVLKSLLVHDPAGHVTHIVLDGEAPVQEAFARLPFGPEALSSPASLAAALTGMPIRAFSGGRAVQGRVLGVAPAHDGKIDASLLSVLTPEGQVQTLRLGADTVLEPMDGALLERLRHALQASGQRQADTLRVLEVGLAGKGERDVTFSYVVAAPVWKSAYRLSIAPDGQARLQGWAVLENASGQDWDAVKVTLVSGTPVMLSQKLYQRVWHTRPELPVAVGTAELPQADTSAMMDSAFARERAPVAMAAPSSSRSKLAEEQAQADPLSVSTIHPPTTSEGQVSVRYSLPAPISVAAGQTVTLPFVDTQVQAEHVSVFQPQRGGIHPVAAVWLKNATSGSLPPGILTVYDVEAGHVGDAELPSIPVGESRFLYFAEDGKVEVRAAHHPQERLSALSISQGVLRAQRLLRRETVYTVKGAADAARSLIIEHPRQHGWMFESDALVGETATHHRLRVSVPAGGTATVRAISSRQQAQTLALLEADEQRLSAWSTNAADDKTRQALSRLAELRRALDEAQQQARMLDEQLERAIENQARIRDNLAAVPGDSALGQRYLERLEQEEDVIADLQQRQQAARLEAAERLRAMEQALASH